MWELRACRGCLNLKCKLEKINSQTRMIYTCLTGLKIEDGDGYPNFFCVECVAMMKKVLALRRKMRRAYYVMKEIMLKKNQVSYYELMTVDRRRTNLRSTVGYWKSKSTGFYSILDEELQSENAKTAESIILLNNDQPSLNNSSVESSFYRLGTDAEASLNDLKPTLTKIVPPDLNNTDTSLKTVVLNLNKVVPDLNKVVPHLTKAVSQLNKMTVIKIEKAPVKYNMLQQYNPDVEGSVKHIIDIKPEKEDFIESVNNTDEDENTLVNDDSQCAEDITEPATDDVPQNIDLTNVFENFAEDQNYESDYSLPEEFPFPQKDKNESPKKGRPKKGELSEKEKKERRERKEKREKAEENQHIFEMKTAHMIKQACSMLALCDIEICTPDQQKNIFKIRKNMPPYSWAKYKCGICLFTFENLDELKNHVVRHNTMVHYRHTCDVCFIKFEIEEALELHVYENHKYLYKCRMCDGVDIYTLSSLISHASLHTNILASNKKEPTGVTRSYEVEGFKLVPLSHENMYLKMSHKDSNFSCEKCNMNFPTDGLLRRHYNRHNAPTASVKCDICKTGHNQMGNLERHMQIWHLYRYECQYCPEIMFNKYEARNHLSEVHNSDMIKQKCDYCDVMLLPRGRAVHMVRRHKNVLRHDCVACGRGFETTEALYTHQFNVHNVLRINDLTVGEESALCRVCNIQFLSDGAYKQHALRKQHEDAQFFENACAMCYRLYDNEEQYKEHMKLHDGPKYPRECSYCGKSFKTAHLFFKHQIKKHEDENPEYMITPKLCELCGERVFVWGKHIRQHEENSSLPLCSHCTPVRRFRSGTKLVRHVLSSHTPQPYVCALCGHSYSGRQECLDHILKLHAPVKPFKCTLCLRRFSHVDYLLDHVKSVHYIKMKKNRQYTGIMKSKIVVYPDMRLNMSFVKPEILAKLRIYLLNYDNSLKEVLQEFSDYIITDRKDELLPDGTKKPRKLKWDLENFDESRRKRQKVDKDPTDVTVKKEKSIIKNERPSIDDDEIRNTYIINGYNIGERRKVDKIPKTKENEKEKERDDKEIRNTYVIGDRRHIKQEIVKEEVIADVSCDNSITIGDETMMGEPLYENNNGELIVDEELQVFEEDGNQYVYLNGVIYKVETD